MNRILTVVAASIVFGGCAHAVNTHESTYSLSQVDVKPVLLGCAEFPVAKNDNWVGATVSFTLNSNGIPQNLSVSNSEASTRSYGSRAVTVAGSCRYKPAMVKGQAVAVRGMYKMVRVPLPAI